MLGEGDVVVVVLLLMVVHGVVRGLVESVGDGRMYGHGLVGGGVGGLG